MISVIRHQFGLNCQGIIFKDTDSDTPHSTSPKALVSPAAEWESDSENFMGNPLELEKIVDLSMESKVLEPLEKSSLVSRLINLMNKHPIDNKPANGYKNGFLYYLSDEKFQLFGLFPLTNSSKRILSIHINNEPDCAALIRDLQRRHMPFSSTCQCSFEAVYSLPHDAMFHGTFDTCESVVLSPPPSFAVGELVVQLKPYDSESTCSSLYKDIIFDAYENDLSTWSSMTKAPSVDQLQVILPNLFRTVSSGQMDTISKGFSGAKLSSGLVKRFLDPTELLWDAMKHVNSVAHFRSLMKTAICYLLNNRELIRLSRSNHTRLARYLRVASAEMGRGPVDPDCIIPPQIECLLEIGLNKLINDCVALLTTVIPDVASLPCLTSENPASDAGTSLPFMWATLHHVYKAACLFRCLSASCSKESYVDELRTILNQESPKDEWRSALLSGSLGEPFLLKHSLSLPVSELVVPIPGIPPTFWVMHLDTEHPMHTSVRLLYELVGTASLRNYVCHEMKLVDSFWLQ
ncbi:hypothetical protein FBUS_10082 [Fasciolopsis buskii]|uniref:Uncharacterized protein n=1 Tax=Fasciolopsis buskii TaxID=27845 RepID=A0A8E0S603_9TREM|nr:hypothetical protein FBUS_10082 [Fasciolopsis buski]